jgi:SAM-dependent methyltransferase
VATQGLRHDNTADKVRTFYDAHPYPPPLDDLDTVRQQGQAEATRRANYHLYWPDQPYRRDLSVLVAGCGTSQAAMQALRRPEAQVIGIDVSATSVSHTEALKRKYSLENLQVYQLSVERVAELGQSFDQIVCTGVLHHLPDPDAGLAALRAVLKPQGALHLMVYATYGRAGIYMLQDYCRRLGVGLTDAEIVDLADTLRALPHEHPLAHLIQQSPDFYTPAGLADALLHPQDRAYTVPEVFEFLQRGGFVFGRWLRQAPYLPQCGTLATTPHGARLMQLPLTQQYAAVELFRGVMLRHSVIAYADNPAAVHHPIDFAADCWSNFVPLRRSETVCVEKQLPPGAAAVLINQGHTFRDLFLPINPYEKHLYDGIDGSRSVDQIVRSLPQRPDRKRARSFFARLWWYDQVVFDMTRCLSS